MEKIELVIKISEEEYTAICENGYIYDEDSEFIAKEIKNGTPLSKIVDNLKELSKDHRHNYISNSNEERAWRLGIEDSIDLILVETKSEEKV